MRPSCSESSPRAREKPSEDCCRTFVVFVPIPPAPSVHVLCTIAVSSRHPLPTQLHCCIYLLSTCTTFPSLFSLVPVYRYPLPSALSPQPGYRYVRFADVALLASTGKIHTKRHFSTLGHPFYLFHFLLLFASLSRALALLTSNQTRSRPEKIKSPNFATNDYQTSSRLPGTTTPSSPAAYFPAIPFHSTPHPYRYSFRPCHR